MTKVYFLTNLYSVLRDVLYKSANLVTISALCLTLVSFVISPIKFVNLRFYLAVNS